MYRTYHTFTVLQAVAAILCLAVLFWSLGIAFTQNVAAANVTSFSDTLSDSAPSIVSNHTISFVSPSGVAAGESIVITFPAGFNLGSVGEDDIDLEVNGVDEATDATASGATWGVDVTGQVVTIESGTDTIGGTATITVKIGSHADGSGTGVNQITNPTVGSYAIGVTSGASDSGETRVAIVDSVTVSAAVDTTFNFTVTGVAPGVDVNGHSTTGSTTPTAIPFGQLVANTASTAGQNLAVTTNAANGFSVTVQVDQQLTSATGADIDGFIDGDYTSSPTAWAAPTPAIGDEDTYGHWGITTEDGFASQNYVSASTTPVEVFSHTGPADGTTAGIGTTQVGYRVEISSLQEAGDDYEATVTYVATPVF